MELRNVFTTKYSIQVVFGERLRASAYEVSAMIIIQDFRIYSWIWCEFQVRFAENVTYGRKLCTKTYEGGNKDDEAKLNFLRERVHESYMHQWVIDNMPVTWCYSTLGGGKPYCTTRFPIGCFVTREGVKDDVCYLSVSSVPRSRELSLDLGNFVVI